MDKSISENRDVALSILNPSERDLEHGLALHADATVVETYGFAPRGSVEPMKLQAAAEAGAGQAALCTMREEMGLIGFLDNAEDRQYFMEAWTAAGVTCVFQNAGEEGQAVKRLLRRLANFTHLTDVIADEIRRAVHPDDIEGAKRDGVGCLCLTGNGVPMNETWITVPDELDFVRTFFQLGIRMMHLTYNRRNMLADGCAESANAGLSDLGRAAIAEMNRTGIIVDVAHAGRQSSLEAAQVSEKPMVASHTACQALHEHMRAKPDGVIRAIADTGGLVGICCIPAFIGCSGDINAFLDHIDYLAKTVGTDHIGIGTDVAYIPPVDERSRGEVPVVTHGVQFESFWPPGSSPGLPQWQQPEQVQSLAWTNWPLFTVGMVLRGYSDDDIRKIIGGNMLRVARTVLEG